MAQVTTNATALAVACSLLANAGRKEHDVDAVLQVVQDTFGFTDLECNRFVDRLQPICYSGITPTVLAGAVEACANKVYAIREQQRG